MVHVVLFIAVSCVTTKIIPLYSVYPIVYRINSWTLGLMIVNSAAVNMGCTPVISVLLGLYPEVESLDLTVIP